MPDTHAGAMHLAARALAPRRLSTGRVTASATSGELSRCRTGGASLAAVPCDKRCQHRRMPLAPWLPTAAPVPVQSWPEPAVVTSLVCGSSSSLRGAIAHCALHAAWAYGMHVQALVPCCQSFAAAQALGVDSE